MTTRDVVGFCGAGGATRGLELAGWRPALCVDGWDKACLAHRRWMPQSNVVRARMETIHELARGPFRYGWASPSCKPWSAANRTPLRGTAHPEYYSLPFLAEQYLQYLGCRWLAIENVGGLVWSKEGRMEVDRLREWCAANRVAMSLPKNNVIASNTLGVAQLRRRVFIVLGPELISIRPGSEWIPAAGTPELLWESPERASNTAILGDDHAAKWSDAYRNGKRTAPAPMACEGTKGSWGTGFARTEVGSVLRGDRGESKDHNWPRRAERGVVDASLPSRHRSGLLFGFDSEVRAKNMLRAEAAVVGDEWGRVNGAARLRASRSVEAGEHPGQHKTRDGHREERNNTGRTLEECARLQQVPLEILAGLSKRDAHQLVGNAVPVSVAKHIGALIVAADAKRGAA